MNEKWREGTTRVGDMSFAIQYLTDNMPEGDYEANVYCIDAYHGLGSYIFTDPEGYVYKAAIEALEKRIPQKPMLESDSGWICPSCGESYGVEYDYCHNCGQAIDWSEVDD